MVLCFNDLVLLVMLYLHYFIWFNALILFLTSSASLFLFLDEDLEDSFDCLFRFWDAFSNCNSYKAKYVYYIFIWYPVNINLSPITWFPAVIIIIIAFTIFPVNLTFLLWFPALKYNSTRFNVFWMFSLHQHLASSFLVKSFQNPLHPSSALVNLSLMVLQEDEQFPSSSPHLTQQTPEIKAPHNYPSCMTT